MQITIGLLHLYQQGQKVGIHWNTKGFDLNSIKCTSPDVGEGKETGDFYVSSVPSTTKYSITCEDIYTVTPSVTPITPTDSPDTPPSTIVVHNAYNSTGNTNKPSGTGFIYNPLYNGGGKNVYITWITGKNYDYCTDVTHNVSGGKDISFQNSGENLKSWTWSGNVWSDINGETRIRCNSLLRGGVDDTFYYYFSHCTDDGVPCSLIKYE